MFRRAAVCAYRYGGVGLLSAAGVALTDKQLSKKSEWYQNAVRDLEKHLKIASKYGYIENDEILDAAQDVFERVVDLNNAELLWRYARALTDKANLVHDPHKKEELLKRAVELAQKAVQLEGSGISGAHKWLAIATKRLLEHNKKAVKDASAAPDQIWAHLKRATELNPQDPYAFHLLGVAYFEKKEYKDAIAAFEKAESIKPGFSSTNLAYLGDAQRLNGKKTEAVETLKKAIATPTRNLIDVTYKVKAKEILIVKLKQKLEDIEFHNDV